MLKKYTLPFVLVLSTLSGWSQCPGGCTIDLGCTISPKGPTICPTTLPSDSTQKDYNTSFTFYLPEKFKNASPSVDVVFKKMEVLSVTNLPIGMKWEAYDYTGKSTKLFYPDANPPGSERGCAKLCGKPLVPYDDSIKIDVKATVVALGNTVEQNQTFYMPLKIHAGKGGNSVFTMTTPVGCNSVSTTVSPILKSNGDPLYVYDWSFGDNTKSALENPPAHTYTTPGKYVITGKTILYEYVLSAVVFETKNEALWCSDPILDLGEHTIIFTGCDGKPDVYFEVYDVANTLLYENKATRVVDSKLPSWNSLDVALSGGPYKIKFIDYDVSGPPDSLGNVTLNIDKGANNYIANNTNFSAELTIIKRIKQTYTDKDTVTVYEAPNIGTLALSKDSACVGDSIKLTLASGYTYVWDRDGNTLSESSNSIYAKQAGIYKAEATADNGCSASSLPINVRIADNPKKPTFLNMNGVLTTFVSGMKYEWFYEGVSIPGAIYDTLSIDKSGNYALKHTNPSGCSTTSPDIFITYTPNWPNSVENVEMIFQSFNAYPNPAKSELTISFETYKKQDIIISIMDIYGKLVVSDFVPEIAGSFNHKLNLEEISTGIYFLNVTIGGYSVNRKIIKD